ncbi:MAG: hypothetical protein HYS24_11965 [Ignavibacteriales bacterium]|nr:hypothetical protein [Ignavibacteriales bacterium]
METLNLSTFIKAADDLELSKYRVLAILRKYSKFLHKNKLYPALAELISIKNELELLIEQMSLFDTEFILNLNFAEFFENFELEQSTKFNDTDLDIVADFIRWALPEIKNSIAEGKAIFDFVDENIILNEVGVMPKNRSEGYFMIQDLKHDLLKIYKFEMSLFSTADNPLRTLKSKLVDLISLQTSEAYNPLDIKHNLIEKFPELQNPATYYFETSIDFPFVETILPVAKRKLVRTLAI